MRILAVLALVGAGAIWAQGAPIDSESGSRLPLLSRADMADDASARIYDALVGPNGERPTGALGVALDSPATAAAFGRIERYL